VWCRRQENEEGRSQEAGEQVYGAGGNVVPEEKEKLREEAGESSEVEEVTAGSKMAVRIYIQSHQAVQP